MGFIFKVLPERFTAKLEMIVMKAICRALGLVLVLFWVVTQTGCSRPQLRLGIALDAGWLVSHDLYLDNLSGYDLSEVKLTITFFGEDASPAVQRYWVKWPLGEKQKISIPVTEVKNIQRVLVEGTAEQGEIHLKWQPSY